jgi:LysM repeat protein
MSPESTSSTSTKLCPTCGTRLNDDAVRCLVCGAEIGSANKPAQPAKKIQGSRMPEITLSIPAAIAMLALFLTIGAVMVFFALRSKPEVIVQITPTSTATATATATITPTDPPPTATSTPQPTPTPLSHMVAANETCIGIALYFGVSVEAIRQANNLSLDCTLSVGRELKIPQPTPTPTPLPTSTLSAPQQTEQACQKIEYEVQEGDTPMEVARNYNVPWEAIKEENGLVGDMLRFGQKIQIPLCRRNAPPGPTPTPTSPAPYLAPNLLLPADGSFFGLSDETVTLQWAAVGALRDNEGYVVIVEHVTGSSGEKLERFVTDTKFIVPSSFRPTDRNAHIYYWSVVTVRQTGTDAEGRPVYEPAGAASTKRSFSWSGSETAPTPSP